MGIKRSAKPSTGRRLQKKLRLTLKTNISDNLHTPRNICLFASTPAPPAHSAPGTVPGPGHMSHPGGIGHHAGGEQPWLLLAGSQALRWVTGWEKRGALPSPWGVRRKGGWQHPCPATAVGRAAACLRRGFSSCTDKGGDKASFMPGCIRRNYSRGRKGTHQIVASRVPAAPQGCSRLHGAIHGTGEVCTEPPMAFVPALTQAPGCHHHPQIGSLVPHNSPTFASVPQRTKGGLERDGNPLQSAFRESVLLGQEFIKVSVSLWNTKVQHMHPYVHLKLQGTL